MSAFIQKRLRIVVCLLLGATVALTLVWVGLTVSRRLIHSIAWQNWASAFTQIMLFNLYSNTMPKRVRFNTLGRTTYIVVVGVFVIYNACFDLPLYGSAARFYDCTPNNGYFPVTDEYFPACAIHRTWTTVAIVATCLAIIEAFYTLFKGPMEHAHFAKDSYTISSPHHPWTTVAIVATCLAIIEAFYTLFKGPMEHAHFAKDSYTISSPHHPCGIQPNMTIPYGEPQPQPQPQPQRLPYQQPIYPIPHQPPQQPFAVMQPAGTSAGAAVSF